MLNSIKYYIKLESNFNRDLTNQKNIIIIIIIIILIVT